jgi:hypothetical protein
MIIHIHVNLETEWYLNQDSWFDPPSAVFFAFIGLRRGVVHIVRFVDTSRMVYNHCLNSLFISVKAPNTSRHIYRKDYEVAHIYSHI